MADYEISTNVRWARIGGQTTILFEIPGSDREIGFDAAAAPSLDVVIEMVNGLLGVVDGEDSWEVEQDKFTENWYATDQGRWNRYQWDTDLKVWNQIDCRDNFEG